MVDYMCASTDRDRHNLPPRPDWTVPTMPTSALSSTTTSGPKSDSTQFLVLSCHVLSRTFRLFLSIHCKNPPTCSKQQVPDCEQTWPLGNCNSSHAISIHILDNDSLLNIFYFYRPITFDAHDNEYARLVGGGKKWVHERWWYQLAHVCQRWRNLILGSPTYLGVCLIFTFGTPIADLLAHSPHLPLIIDYTSGNDITAEDEEALFLALEQRDRVRRIRLAMLVPSLQKVVMAIDEEYPILEYLIILPLGNSSTALVLPETLRAPHLRHLMLSSFALPIGSLLLTTAVGLVTLCLVIIGHPSIYFQPHTLLQWLSAMPQLETLAIFIS